MNYISGIQYPSGRRIYCDEAPERGEFIDHPQHARRFPSRDSAAQAVESLIRFFEIRNRAAIRPFVEPCHSPL